MAEPIVFISRFRLAPGRSGDVEAAFADAVDLIESSKPRTIVFAAYVDDGRSELRIMHVFADAEAMERHFAGSAQRSAAIAGLVEPAGFEVYGAAPDAPLDQLRDEASAAGVELAVFARPIGGFVRTAHARP